MSADLADIYLVCDGSCVDGGAACIVVSRVANYSVTGDVAWSVQYMVTDLVADSDLTPFIGSLNCIDKLVDRGGQCFCRLVLMNMAEACMKFRIGNSMHA